MLTGVADIGRSLSDAMQPVARGARVLEEILEQDRATEARASLAQRIGFCSSAMSAAASAHMGAADAVNAAYAGTALLASVLPDAPDVMRGALPPNALKHVRELIDQTSFALPASVTGATYLARADSLFREAYAADPALAGAFRSVAMVLAESARWDDLEAFARAHTERFPRDGNAWMALGLALHRRGETRRAAATFDTAMTVLDPQEVRYLENLARVVAPSRAREVNVAGQHTRAALWNVFWLAADPLWSDGTMEWRTEFRARVAFAELRWTVDELELRGADTDRGDIFIRYGPPDMTAAFGPNTVEHAPDVMTFWMYRSGLMFAFSGMAGYATARIPPADEAMVAVVRAAQSARWDNVPILRPDSMTAEAARFRASRDSVDLLLTVVPPTDRLADSSTGEIPRADLWLVASHGVVVVRDSARLDAPGSLSWRPRVERGEFLLRMEATGQGSPRGARAAAELDAGADFPTSGPGVSDLLIARSATDGSIPAERWSGLMIVPALGVAPRGSSLALVWEQYELGATAGQTDYEVAVTIARERGTAGAIAASITAGVASLLRREVRDDRIVIRFDRRPAAAPVVLENVTLALGDTPPGTYAVRVEITDRVSGATHSLSGRLTVLEE
jgi:GWxTD domain-containing protein